jgi:hypothetical protein
MYLQKRMLLIIVFALQQSARPVDDGTIRSIINDPKAIATLSPDTIIAPTIISSPDETLAQTESSQRPVENNLKIDTSPDIDLKSSFHPGINVSMPIYQPGDETFTVESNNDSKNHVLDKKFQFHNTVSYNPMEDGIKPLNLNFKWHDNKQQNQAVPFMGPIPIGPFPLISNETEDEGHGWSHQKFEGNDHEDDNFRSIDPLKLSEKIKEARVRLDRAEEALAKTADAKKTSTESIELQKALEVKNQSIKDYKHALARYRSSKVFFDDKEAFDEYQKSSFIYSKLTRMLSRQNR